MLFLTYSSSFFTLQSTLKMKQDDEEVLFGDQKSTLGFIDGIKPSTLEFTATSSFSSSYPFLWGWFTAAKKRNFLLIWNDSKDGLGLQFTRGVELNNLTALAKFNL